jgi:predicted SnoaL-like aldol condensation-catalyzing enzyme
VNDAAAMRRVVLRYFDCLDREDWQAMRSIWHEHAQLRAVGARPRDDRDSVIEFFSKLFKPWPQHIDKPVRLIISEPDQTILAEVQFIGQTLDGRQVVFDAIDVFDFADDGRIRKLSNWYDIDYARRMIAPAATIEA